MWWATLASWLNVIDVPWGRMAGFMLVYLGTFIAAYLVGVDHGTKRAIRKHGCAAKIAERYRREEMTRGEG